MPDVDPSRPFPPRLVLYDGVCGMCNGFVQGLLDRDRDGVLSYAPLQGELAAEVRRRHPEVPEALDTLVFVDQGHAHVFSESALRILAELPWPWRALSALRVIPRPLRDAVYKQVAARRYSLFGTVDSCRLPTLEQSARFFA